MSSDGLPEITAVEVVLPCKTLDPNLDFFINHLGFAVAVIFPADHPKVAVIQGHGLRLRLDTNASGEPGTLRLLCRNPGNRQALTAPNGTRIEWHHVAPPLVLPPLVQSFVHTTMAGNANWVTGRAGMQYRDLIPDRQGGRFIASHIRIPQGGPVPDYAHFHKIRFQMIYVYKGWVRVVYEDQGAPFIMREGDCVLQPPEIRHRVLESAPDGLEVIELGCPAEHETLADPGMTLPTDRFLPHRNFGGQRFVFHQAVDATWQSWRNTPFQARDLGIAAATDHLAGVHVTRTDGSQNIDLPPHQGEFQFYFILAGHATLHTQEAHALQTGDALVIPPNQAYRFVDCSADFALLDVSLPS